MVSLSVPEQSAHPADGLRPVNLRNDLGQLADLIELAFHDTMDSSGRAAVREMRALSHIGPGLHLLAGVNDLTQGMNLGYVWEADGKVVGNVSVYPATWPAAVGPGWIIANVAVHPDYRRRGIAGQLMEASMAMIRARGGHVAVLQVDADNVTARRLYEQLGFTGDGVWVHWRRSPGLRVPSLLSDNPPYITRARRGEWRAEYALAQRVRPAEHGGLGWLRPLHPAFFHRGALAVIRDWFALRSHERLIIRSPDERALLASLWIESGFAASSVQLTLLADPEYQGLYDDALLNLAVRRFGARSPITIEHPEHDRHAATLLARYGFRQQRTLVHMRWMPGR